MNTTRTHGAQLSFDRDAGDTRRSLAVNAKILLCLLPEFDQVSITVLDDTGDVETWASDGDLVTDLDRLQRQLGEGPAIETLSRARTVVAPDIRRDDRWPRYVRAATQLGLRSQIAIPLRRRDDWLRGTLNTYSTTHAHIELSAPLVAQVVASQIVSVLASLREIERLDQALAERTVIGQACGLVMAGLLLDADHAFECLRSVAAHQDQTLVHVAEEVVRTRVLPSVRPA